MARPKAQTKTNKRFYQGQQELDSDLFKLDVAQMMKNISWNEKRPDYVKVEHCHFMRTVDSSGKKLDTCSPVGGHFHTVTITEHEDGSLSAECSPAQQWGTLDGKRAGVPIPSDNHTHDVTYLKSIKIKPRVYNEKFAEVQSRLLAKLPPSIDGISG